jgi:hypothetical protein
VEDLGAMTFSVLANSSRARCCLVSKLPLLRTLRLVSVQVFLCTSPAQQLLDRIYDRPQNCGAFLISFP